MSLAACGGSGSSDPAKVTVLPANSVQFDLADQFVGICGTTSCAGAKKVLIAGAADAGLTLEGDTVKVGFTLDAWQVVNHCDINGCTQFWEIHPFPVCYAVSGSSLAPSTGCATGAPVAKGPTWNPNDTDPLSDQQNLARSLFGVANGRAVFTPGLGRSIGSDGLWWGDVTITPESYHEFWGFEANPLALPFSVVLGPASAGTSPVALLLPAQDATKVAARTFVNTTAGVTTTYWADRSDEVFAVSLSQHQVLGRRVRKAVTLPLTITVGLLEAPQATYSLVLTPSTISLSGFGGGGTVYNLSLMKTAPEPANSPAPLVPFAGLWAHTPDGRSLVACFNEPLDETQLSLDQFSVSDELQLLSAEPSVVAQCVNFRTSPQRRSSRYQLTAKHLHSRSGAVLAEAVLSFTPDDAAGSAVQRVSSFETKGLLPREGGGALASTGPVFGLIDPAGVTFHHLEQGVRKPAISGLAVTVEGDPSAGGVWANWAESASSGVLALQETSGVETVWRTADVPAAQLVNGGLLAVVGDGSVLVWGTGTPMVRFQKGSPPQVLTALASGGFRGIEPTTHEVLFEQGQRFARLQLPATISPVSYAKPAQSTDLRSTACDSQGTTYWCGAGTLWKLGDTSSANVASCRTMSGDGHGTCWVTAFPTTGTTQTLTRVTGTTLTPVSLPNPLKPGEFLYAPQFVGEVVLLNDQTLRLSRSEWAALPGVTP